MLVVALKKVVFDFIILGCYHWRSSLQILSFIGGTSPNKGPQSGNAVVHGVLLFLALALAMLGCNAAMR
jgi:hypothetical protein